jgi:hypothetical protein
MSKVLFVGLDVHADTIAVAVAPEGGEVRSHKRYKTLSGRGKNKNQIVTALGRELLGFVWATATSIERQPNLKAA